MKFKCAFPNCNYETENRQLIELHHFIPKEIQSEANIRINNNVTIPLCPNHHKLIFHPLVNSGQHSIKNENSLEITNVTNSNKGKCIIFKDINGNEIITYPEYECKPIEPIYVSYWCAIGGLIMDKVYDCTDIDLSCLIEHDRMFISGMHVYYVYEKRKDALNVLLNIIENYMKTSINEHDALIKNARNSWKIIKNAI